jgi:hypothetical protein
LRRDVLYRPKRRGKRLICVTFEYKCVAGPTIVAVKNAKARDQAVRAFEDIMNAEAAQGWEYVGIDEFHVSEPQGMFTRKRVYVPSKILVFRREKAAIPAVVAAAPPVAVEPAATLPAPPAVRPVTKSDSVKPEAAVDGKAAADAGEDGPTSIKTIADNLKVVKP